MILFSLSFQSASFYFHFHTPAKCILLYSQFSMMSFIFSGKWTIHTLKIPIIRLTQRFILWSINEGNENEAREKRESVGVFSPIKPCFRGRGYLKSAAWQLKRNKQKQKFVERDPQFHTFESLSEQIYCSSNSARYTWREKNNIERMSCFSSTLNKWLYFFRRIWENLQCHPSFSLWSFGEEYKFNSLATREGLPPATESNF